MNKLIKGENMILSLNIDGDYFPVFCAKSCTINISQDELEVTNINSGSARVYIAGMSNSTVSCTGISTIDNTEGKVAITYLMQQSVRRVVHPWRVYLEADNGDTLEAVFDGFIRDTIFDRQGFGYGQALLTIRVSGDIDFQVIIDPPPGDFEIFADYWQTVNGQNYISGASTGETDGTAYTLQATDEILDVAVEGDTFYATTGAPTDGEPEYRFTTGPERVTFPSALIFDGAQRVYVMFKRPI